MVIDSFFCEMVIDSHDSLCIHVPFMLLQNFKYPENAYYINLEKLTTESFFGEASVNIPPSITLNYLS